MSKTEKSNQPAKQHHGEKDATQKMLFDRNDVFADVLNTLFNLDEKEQIKPEDLSVAETFSIYKLDGEVYSQERDVAKYVRKFGAVVSLIGYEFQSKSEPNMPVRVMSYDAASYRGQLNNNKKSGKLYPVITIVLYSGKTRWTGNLDLFGCLDLTKIPPEMRGMVSNYQMKNLVDLSGLTEDQVRSFASCFQIVALFFYKKAHGQTDKFTDLYKKEWDKGNVAEAFDTINAFEQERIFTNKWLEREDIMPKTKVSLETVLNPFISDLADMRVEEQKKQLEKQADEQKKQLEKQADEQKKQIEHESNQRVVQFICSIMKADGVSVEEAMEKLSLSAEERPKYKAMVEKLQKEQS